MIESIFFVGLMGFAIWRHRTNPNDHILNLFGFGVGFVGLILSAFVG